MLVTNPGASYLVIVPPNRSYIRLVELSVCAEIKYVSLVSVEAGRGCQRLSTVFNLMATIYYYVFLV